ncbi:hypothetical protein ADL12_45750 [Streptomyces regalis]|uniref:Uncharacterized protein n=1 Tax=Streptomyces regalis TaxID=68262 RepID=A0A101J6J2_9ACTN|nr:hypothetical protein ADL12_45750 [Streptomyces regalis]
MALQPDQRGVERLGEGGGERGLADARVALAEERPAEAQGQEAGDGEAVVDEVPRRIEAGPHLLRAVHAGDRAAHAGDCRSPHPGGRQHRPLGEYPRQMGPVLG